MTTPNAAAPPNGMVVAVSRATPAHQDIRGKRVFTSIVRTRSTTPLVLTAEGPDGNETAVHTEHVLAFPAEHYDFWADRLGVARNIWPLTLWGENIVFRGLMEHELPIGTMLRVGPSAVLQVTSPRNPCFKLSWRLNQPDSMLPDLLTTGRCGFYLRVLVPGPVFDGDTVRAVLPAMPTATVSEVAGLMAKGNQDLDRIAEVLQIESLGAPCAAMLRQRVTDGLDQRRTKTNRWQGWRPFGVTAVDQVTADVKSFVLSPLDDGPLAGYRAGQHVRVRLPGAARPFVRAWSLSDYDESPSRYRVTIKRSGRQAASAHMHDEVRVGTVLDVASPSGSFVLDRSSNHPTILISAGIGMTPLLAMLKAYAGLAHRAPPVHWIHVTRDGTTDAHRGEVDGLVRDRRNILRHVRYTAPGAQDRPGIDYDAAGRLSLQALRGLIGTYRYPIFGREVSVPGAASEIYVCGPPGFEADLRLMLQQLGVAPQAVRSEQFGSGADADGTPARIAFARSGITVDWVPGSSLLEAAEEAGIQAEHECRAGTCHQCAVVVLEGATAYRRAPAKLPEAGTVLACCSRPASPYLVLDL